MSENASNSTDDRHWEVFRAELHSSADRQTILRVIADSGAAVTGADRLILLDNAEGSLNVLAITGTRSVNARADQVQSLLELCHRLTGTSSFGKWITEHNDATSDSPGVPSASNSARTVRLDRLTPPATGSTSTSRETANGEVITYLLAETSAATMGGIRRYEEAVRECSIAIQRCQNSPRSKSSAWKKLLVATTLIVAGLILIPWEFELEVRAFAFPKERRSVFAPENGIVDQISVTEGSEIQAGQTLLTLKNSQLTMQLRQLQGEKDTTAVRLRALGIAKTSAPAGSELAQELIREELQLEQKFKTLEAETSLLQEQIDSLTLRAPISGMVFQRSLHERLDQRPVQRGQRLLEVGETDGSWELELQIPATSAGYVPIPLNSTVPESGKTIPVRFRTGDADKEQGLAELRMISMGAEISEGRLVCIATADILPDQNNSRVSLRPGQAVTARISCGRRSLGFVLFRDAIQYLRRMWFIWT
ncbi:MAG: biotin/lipoyl-binding protein [Planctomycetaceae bacterium]